MGVSGGVESARAELSRRRGEPLILGREREPAALHARGRRLIDTLISNVIALDAGGTFTATAVVP